MNEVQRTDLPLVEIVDRLLERGAVIAGGATISVAGVDLIELRLNVVLAASDTFMRSLADLADGVELVITLAWRTRRTLAATTGQAYLEARGAERREAEQLVERLLTELAVDRALIRQRICPREGIAATVAVVTEREMEEDIRTRVRSFGQRERAVTVAIS